MDCPLYWEDRPVGTLRLVPAGADTCFSLEAAAPPGLYRVWACGDRGELLLGIWEGGAFRRRFSRALTAPAGRIRRGCLRPTPRSEWLAAAPDDFPGWPTDRGLWRRRGGGRELALPFGEDGPFPIPELFCLARIAPVDGRRRAVFRFDGSGRPVLPEP